MNTAERFGIIILASGMAVLAGIPRLIWIGGLLGALVMLNGFLRWRRLRRAGINVSYWSAIRDMLKGALYLVTAAVIEAVNTSRDIENALEATLYILIMGELEELLNGSRNRTDAPAE